MTHIKSQKRNYEAALLVMLRRPSGYRKKVQGVPTDNMTFLSQSCIKLDGVAPLIANPSPANFTTMHSRLVCHNSNLCPGSTAYLLSPAKPP